MWWPATALHLSQQGWEKHRTPPLHQEGEWTQRSADYRLQQNWPGFGLVLLLIRHWTTSFWCWSGIGRPVLPLIWYWSTQIRYGDQLVDRLSAVWECVCVHDREEVMLYVWMRRGQLKGQKWMYLQECRMNVNPGSYLHIRNPVFILVYWEVCLWHWEWERERERGQKRELTWLLARELRLRIKGWQEVWSLTVQQISDLIQVDLKIWHLHRVTALS